MSAFYRLLFSSLKTKLIIGIGSLLLLSLSISCKNDNASAGAVMFHGNEAHTGVYKGSGFKSFGKIKWVFKTTGKIFSSPAISDGRAFIGSEDSTLYAINTETGELQWKFPTGGAIPSSPAIYNHNVYFTSYDGYLYVVDAATGREIRKFKTGGEKKVGAYGLWTMKPTNMYMEDLYDFFLSSPVIDVTKGEAIVCFGSSDGYLYALDATTGALKWKFKTGGIIHSSPAVYNHTVYVASWDTYLYALDISTGKEKWRFKTGEQPVYHVLEGIQASPTVQDSVVYLGARDGYFYALNANTGALLWKFFNNSSWVLTTAAIKDSTVYYGTSDSYMLYAMDSKTGKERYHFKANGYIYSSPVIAGQTLYFGDFTGQLFALDMQSEGKKRAVFSTPGRKTKAATVLNPKGLLDFGFVAGKADPILYETGVKVMDKFYTLGSIVSSPVVTDDCIYFGSADSCLYAVNLK